jgi:hypothetical protein
MPRRRNSVSAVILPDELIVEIFTLLPVKPLIRFRCVNKFFKTLISDPYFVQMHLNKSSRNWQLALTYYEDGRRSLPSWKNRIRFLVGTILGHGDDPNYLLNDHLLLEHETQNMFHH